MQHVARMMMCLTVLALLSSCASVPEGSISLPSLLLDAPAAWAKGDYTKAAQLFDAISGHQDATTEIQNESRFFAGVAYHQIGNEEEAMRRFKVLTWDIERRRGCCGDIGKRFLRNACHRIDDSNRVAGRKCAAQARCDQQVAGTNVGIVGQEREIELVDFAGADRDRSQYFFSFCNVRDDILI